MADPLSRARKQRMGLGSGTPSSKWGLGHPSKGWDVKGLGKAIWNAVPSFPDDRYANQRGRAEAGWSYSTKGLTRQQAANVNQRARIGRQLRGK